MKTPSPVSSLRMASAAAALAILAVSPAWAEKYASIVVDMDSHKVLHARDADESRYPASLTKVMTLYLVFDALDSGKLKLSDRLPVSRHASRQQPSKLGLRVGQTIKVQDAIRALVTKSANDVAVVLAEKLGGSESKFAVLMNAKAKELGLENTNFRNASGLPDSRQTTTARDLEKLGEAMFFDHRDRYNYFSTPEFTWRHRHYENHNKLLAKVPGVDGIKTGYTNASGYNLMASAERDGHRVIAVMLGGSTGQSRDEHVADLLEAAFVSIQGGVSVFADSPDANAKVAAVKGAVRPKNAADALAFAQLQKFAAIDAAVEAEADNPADVAQDDNSTEEGDASDGTDVTVDDGADDTSADASGLADASADASDTAAADAVIPAVTQADAAPASTPAVADAVVAEPAPAPAPVVDSPLLAAPPASPAK